MQFIGAIATQGGSALEIVDLMEKEIARQRYQEELATARRIQQSILPAALPSLEELSVSAISHPAEAVGGDYYNVIALDDEHLLVIVADVSGKGLPASFYMAELHGMVCIASATCATASEMLRIINDHLYRQMPRGTFITATALLVDTRQHRISLARAGHTPLIVRNGSGTVTFSPPGPALGFVHGQQFTTMLREQQIGYTPGDTFILYSDGVSEMMNGQHEEFTDERLLALIDRLDVTCADAVRDAIVQAVDDFRDGAEQNDDVTVVVVQSMEEDRSVAQHSTGQLEVA
jgi:sigma-B regulation protein RsbU (phosphoserine phosphatase)